MVHYDLSHLTQAQDQRVHGPIQDDEALFLFALIRVMDMRHILEIGEDSGYSAKNFCAAVAERGMVWSIDKDPCPRVADNHRAVHKDIAFLEPADVDNQTMDLVFFDCHAYEAQLSLFYRFQRADIITDQTVLVLHDTNLWPSQITQSSYEIDEGWVHTPPERQMANDFAAMGYDVFALGTRRDRHGAHLPFRCGLTIVSKFRPFHLLYGPRAPWMVNEAKVSAQYVKSTDHPREFDYDYIGERP